MLIPQLYSSSTFFFFFSSCIVIDIQHYMSLRNKHYTMKWWPPQIYWTWIISYRYHMEEIENNCFPCEENSIYFKQLSYCVQQCYIYHVCYISSTYLSCNRKSVFFLKKIIFGCTGSFIALQKAFSSCSKWGSSRFRSTGSSLQRLLSLWSRGPWRAGFSSCSGA